MSKKYPESRLREVFNKMDRDGDGGITQEEMEDVLRKEFNLDKTRVRQIAEDVMRDDPNQDGRITWEEFKAIMNKC